LNQCPLITDIGIRYLTSLKNDILSINLSKCHHITDCALEALGIVQSLKVLLLSDLRITDSGLKSLMNLELIELDLSRTPITNQSIQILHNSKMRHSLEKLTLIETALDQTSEFLKLANFSSIRKINVVGTKFSLDGSLIKLQEKMNNMAHREISKITRGSILEIHRPVKESSHAPSENQKAIWESQVGPRLTPYLNQIIPWPEVILPSPPPPPSPIQGSPNYLLYNLNLNESPHESPSPNLISQSIFLSPISPSLKKLQNNRRQSSSDSPSLIRANNKRTPSALRAHMNNENLPPLDYNIFPKSPKEVTTGSWVLSQQLMIDVISPLSKRNYEPSLSPFSPSNKRLKKTSGDDLLGYENPLPNILTDLLQIKSMSPSVTNERKKSEYHY